MILPVFEISDRQLWVWTWSPFLYWNLGWQQLVSTWSSIQSFIQQERIQYVIQRPIPATFNNVFFLCKVFCHCIPEHFNFAKVLCNQLNAAFCLNISIKFGKVFLIPANFIFYRHINIFNHFYSSFIVVELSIFFIGLLKQLIIIVQNLTLVYSILLAS